MSAYVGALRSLGWGALASLLLVATLAATANDCPADSASPCQTITNGR